MKKKKVAGTERPYTFQELFRIVADKAKEMNVPYLDQLDYWTGEDKEADDYTELDFYLELARGGSEGIYACICTGRCSGRRHVCTLKTLGEGDEDFVAMARLGAELVNIANDFVYKHEDDFVWRGYNVGYWDGKTMVDNRMCYREDDAREALENLRRWPHLNGRACYIRNNATREFLKV